MKPELWLLEQRFLGSYPASIAIHKEATFLSETVETLQDRQIALFWIICSIPGHMTMTRRVKH